MQPILDSSNKSFLESLDSTLIQIGDDGQPTPESRPYAAVEAGLQILGELAMGRPVVVPQSYAFDSAVFNDIAPLVLSERDRAFDNHPYRFRPFTFPRYGGFTLDEYIAGKVSGGKFVSSLWPDYWTRIVEERAGSVSLIRRLVDDQRTYGLAVISREATDVPTTNTIDLAKRYSLGSLVARLAEECDPTRPGTYVTSPPSAERLAVANQLFDAMTILGDPIDLEQACKDRSLLRSNDPYPGLSKPVRELIDDSSRELLIEAVDALYNFVLAASSAVDLQNQLYVASKTSGLNDLVKHAIAQDIAMEGSAGQTADTEAYFVASGPKVTLNELKAGFRLLFEDFASENGVLHDTLTQVRDARRNGTATSVDSALNEHLDAVSKVLAQTKGFKVSLQKNLRQPLSALIGVGISTSAGLVADGVMTDIGTLPVGVVGGLVGWLVKPAMTAWTESRSGKRKAADWSDVLASTGSFNTRREAV
jgi:hypothetical protein